MPTITKETLPRGAREFDTPEDFRDRTFFDAFADVFTNPEDLTLHRPDCGFMARIRDGLRISGDVHKALDALSQQKNPNRAATATD